MNNETNRPVIFFDLETTGKDKDTNNIRIIQMSAIKYKDVENFEEIDRKEMYFSNGDVPIQPDATAIHGYTADMLKDKPTFHECAHEVFDFFKGCDLGGYNNSFFDNSVLFHSFNRAGIRWDYRDLKIYDILNLWRKNHSSKLTYVYKFYTGEDLDNAHDATSDVEATVEVYKRMKERGEDFEEDELKYYKDNLDLIGDFKIREENGEKIPYYGFGQHQGETVESVGIGYLEWMIKYHYRFPLDTIHVAKQLIKWLEKKYAQKSKEITSKNWYDE